MLPPTLLALVDHALGGAPIVDIAPTEGGFSNLSCYATIGTERCVIKAATRPAKRADVRREAAILPHLAAQGLPVPRLLAFAEDSAWSVAVTGALPGRVGLQVLDNDPAALPTLYAQLAPILVATHRAAPPANTSDLLLTERVAQARATLASLALPPSLATAIHASLAAPIWQQTHPRLLHGDIGLHNLLWDGQQIRLLDWEWAGLGPPLLDLAWLGWTISWRGLPAALWHGFLGAYRRAGGTTAGMTKGSVQACTLAQIGLIMARVSDQPAALAEWIRRGEWTLSQAQVP